MIIVIQKIKQAFGINNLRIYYIFAALCYFNLLKLFL